MRLCVGDTETNQMYSLSLSKWGSHRVLRGCDRGKEAENSRAQKYLRPPAGMRAWKTSWRRLPGAKAELTPGREGMGRVKEVKLSHSPWVHNSWEHQKT